jgi:transcriptional regulator with XRE-family HTH domain
MSGLQSPPNTHGDHVGAQLRSGREAVGWSRTDVHRLTEISVAKIARIENTGRGTPEELNAYRSALKIALGEVVSDDDQETTTVNPAVTQSPAVTGFLGGGVVRLTEWNGLRRGDVIALVGEKGRFKFLFYHEDDHQCYVEVSGPLTSYRGHVTGRQLRSVRPDKVIIQRRR